MSFHPALLTVDGVKLVRDDPVRMHTICIPPFELEIRIIVMAAGRFLAGSISAALLAAQVIGNGNYTGADLLGHLGRGGNRVDIRFDRDLVTILDTTGFGIRRMNLEHVLAVPDIVRCAACLCADVVLREDTSRG